MFSQHTLKDYASAYYSGATINVPMLHQREFYGRQGTIGSQWADRPLAYGDVDELRADLVKRPPIHFYSSSAYYLDPGYKDTSAAKNSMGKKGWLGQDLIFDLDADHLPGVGSYLDSLTAIGKDAIRLMDDFLIGDFGFTHEQIDVRYSGSRGFHIVIDHESVTPLSSEERAGIENHVLGNALSLNAILKVGNLQEDHFGKQNPTYKLHDSDRPGWSGKFTNTLSSLISEVSQAAEGEERMALLKSWLPLKDSYKQGVFGRPRWNAADRKRGSGPALKGVEKMLTTRSIIMRLASSGDLTAAFRSSGLKQAAQLTFIQMVTQQTQLRYGCEIDGITKDIKRQLRMPGSLHLGRGNPCMRIKPDLMHDSQSLLDTAAQVIGDQMVTTRLFNDLDVDIGEEVSLSAGTHELPRWKALRLVVADTKLSDKKKKDALTEVKTP